MLGAILRDLRYAARGLRRAPGFTAAAVLTLALGIGATTTVFSVVYGVLFRPLPFPNAERLVEVVQLIASRTATSEAPSRAGLSVDQFIELQEHSQTLIVGRYLSVPGTLTGIATPVRLNGARVSASLFASLGIAPLIGRSFSAAEETTAGADPVIVLSYRTWTQYFGRDAAMLGRRITWNGTPHRVVGVMPPGFGFPSLASRFMSRNAAGELDDSPEFWLPAVPLTRLGARSGFSLFPVLGLLRDGVTLEQAAAEVKALLPALPDGREPPSELVSARVEMTRELRPILAIFQIGVTLILLIAAVNVANLLLARAFARERELAVRLALGASRARIAREGMAESVLLSLSGGAFGCLFAYAFSGAVRSLPPHVLPRLQEVQVDAAVLAFAFAISVGTGVAVGVFSAFRATRSVRLAPEALHGGIGNRRLRPSSVLVVAEIAATMVLLAGAALLINSFARLMQVNPGFDPKGVVTFRVDLPPDRYPTTDAQERFYRSLAGSLDALPGVEFVGGSNSTLQAPNIHFEPMSIGGQSVGEGDITIRHVTPDYFAALRVPLKRGRTFGESDRLRVAQRVVVNEAFVRKYMPTGDPVGRVIGFLDRPSLEVVGVVADAKEALDDQPAPTFYLPADEKGGFRELVMFVRTSSDPLALLQPAREAVRRLDPFIALYDPTTLEQWLANSSASPRLYGLISFASGAIALLLAGIGLYGVLAHSVSSRTREFGIRMALGARTERLIAGVVRQGLALAACGIVLGLAGAYYASRFLETLLFGLSPRDPGTFAIAAVMFFSVAMVACYVPSRRATRVNPVVALRAE
jgi:putative ABC transport system permease protein